MTGASSPDEMMVGYLMGNQCPSILAHAAAIKCAIATQVQQCQKFSFNQARHVLSNRNNSVRAIYYVASQTQLLRTIARAHVPNEVSDVPRRSRSTLKNGDKSDPTSAPDI